MKKKHIVYLKQFATLVRVGLNPSFTIKLFSQLFLFWNVCRANSEFIFILMLSVTNRWSFTQGFTKRCRLSWLINSALVYEPTCGGRGELRGLIQWVHLCTWIPNKIKRSNCIFYLFFSRTQCTLCTIGNMYFYPVSFLVAVEIRVFGALLGAGPAKPAHCARCHITEAV
jgi:hypothetical protein